MSEESPALEVNSRPRRSGSVIKILCPYYVAGAVIGKGGENIKEIKERSDAAVVVSQNNVRFPGTNERVISIRGSMDAIKICVNMIQEKIRTDQPPENVKGPRTENEKRKQCCKLVVSDNTLGRIIGKAGKTVQEMKNKYNVEINTTRRSETPFGLDERAISIEGEEGCVDECTEEIIKIVCEDTYASMRFVTDYDMFFMDRRYLLSTEGITWLTAGEEVTVGCAVVMVDRAGTTCTPQPSCGEVTVAAEVGTTTVTVTTQGEKTVARTEVAEIQDLKYVT